MPPYKKFKEGLNDLGLNYEGDVEFWKYRGGDRDSDLVYFMMLYPGRKLPHHQKKCVCDVKIVKNCFISRYIDSPLLTIGRCCIKHFMKAENSGRTCEVCDSPHRNRKDNRCHECRDNGYARVSCYRCNTDFKRYDEYGRVCNSCKAKKWCMCGNEIPTDSTLLNCDTCEEKKLDCVCNYCKCHYKCPSFSNVCVPCTSKNRCLCGVELLPGKVSCYLCSCKNKKYCLGCKSIIRNEKYDICFPCHQKTKNP